MNRLILVGTNLTLSPAPPRALAYPIEIPPGALHFASDIVHEGMNENGHIFLAEEMRRAWQTFEGTPLDVDHEFKVRSTVGGIYDAALVDRSGVLTIRVAAFINARLFPVEAWLVQSRILRGISMECVFERAERQRDGRILRGIRFIGAGLTRVPADPDAVIDRWGDATTVSAAASLTPKEMLLYVAAMAA